MSSERSAAATTHVAPGAKISGEITGTSNLVVDGTVEGQIRVDSDVAIGREGRVKGNLSAHNVKIGGRVQGNVKGRDKVEILASGRLEGDVVSPRMVLAEGAFFKGKVEMTGAQAGDQPAKRSGGKGHR